MVSGRIQINFKSTEFPQRGRKLFRISKFHGELIFQVCFHFNLWSCLAQIWRNNNNLKQTWSLCTEMSKRAAGKSLKFTSIVSSSTKSKYFCRRCVVLVPVENEDMWHAYNLIAEGDLVKASTIRKVCDVKDSRNLSKIYFPSGSKWISDRKQHKQQSPHFSHHQSRNHYLRYTSLFLTSQRKKCWRKSIR